MYKRLLILSLTFVSYAGFCQQKNELSLVDSLLLDSRYQEAIRVIDASADKAKEPILLSLRKVNALIRLGKLADAEKLLKETQVVVDKEKNQLHYNALIAMYYGSLYQNQGRNDLAIEQLQKALKLLDEDKRSSSLEAAEALAYLGNVYRTTGKFAQAEEQLQLALSIREEKLSENHELIAASYNDLGLVYTQLDPDKALNYYEKALAIYTRLHGQDHPKLAITNTNLGVVYRSEKLYGDAVVYFESAQKIWEKIYPNAHPNKALVLMNLGQTYSSMGNTKVALEFYEKARVMYESAQGKKHPDVAYVYNLIGNEMSAQGNFDEALRNYQKALVANIPDFNSEDVFVNPDATAYYNGNQLLYSLMYKAEALEARHLQQTLKVSDLLFAIETLQTADLLIDGIRKQISNESDKISLGAISNEVYADGVRISYLLSDVSFRHRKAYRELSFYFAEKSKSAVLLEAISDTNAKSYANIPNELIEDEKNLKAGIALIAQKLAQKPTEDEEKKLREKLFSLNQQYQEFTKRLETQYPEYFNLKYNAASPSITQLQQLMPPETALISYFIDEKNARLYTYLITKTHFSIADAGLPAAYDKYVTGLRNGINFSEIKSFVVASRDLDKILIPKRIPKNVNDLVIIPTGRMSIIPFETLLIKDAKGAVSFNELPYLIKKYSVRYEFSAGLVLQKKRDLNPISISSIMVCAPVTFPKSDNLNDLPGTESEVNTIAKLFEDKNIDSKVFLRGQATEAAIKSGDLKDYSLIHFATHGIVDESSPELSRIFLQNDSKAEDGNLFAGEIYNLQFNANLVALSACETGLGKISKGEGVIGLSRALVYAGAKNIVVSFWSVADESTALLMTDFYRQMLANKQAGYSRNLRQAKLDLMAK